MDLPQFQKQRLVENVDYLLMEYNDNDKKFNIILFLFLHSKGYNKTKNKLEILLEKKWNRFSRNIVLHILINCDKTMFCQCCQLATFVTELLKF